jgi:hypothetical protein
MGLMDALKRKKGGGQGTGRQALVNLPGQQPVKVRFEGGSGDSLATAIVIKGATSKEVGVAAEYKYLGHVLGERGRDWKVEQRSITRLEGRSYETLEITLTAGGARTVFFDITEYASEP